MTKNDVSPHSYEINLPLQWSILASLLVIAVICVLPGLGTEFKAALLGEEGFIEIASAGSYIAGAIMAFLIAKRMTSPIRYHYFMWFICCLVFFGEETSWMQHYLGFSTPESLKVMNAQNEFNLHNLNFFHGRKLINGGSFVDMDFTHIFLSSQMLFQLGFAFYFLFLPALQTLAPARNFFSRLGFPKLKLGFCFPILAAIIVGVIVTTIYRSDALTKSVLAEARELIFAVSIMAFLIIAYRKSSAK